MITRTLHLNPQAPPFDYTRGCMFCKQIELTGEHARACPGKAHDVRTWSEQFTDKDGEAVRKAGD